VLVRLAQPPQQACRPSQLASVANIHPVAMPISTATWQTTQRRARSPTHTHTDVLITVLLNPTG